MQRSYFHHRNHRLKIGLSPNSASLWIFPEFCLKMSNSAYAPHRHMPRKIRYVVSIYSKYTAEKKVSRVMGGDSSTSDYLNIFSRVHIVFLTMPSFSWWTSAQSQICSEDTVQNFEIVFLNIDHTGIQCHVSLFNDYTGTQCHMSSITTMVVNVTCRRTRVLLPP